jgi:hypothetical protein
LEAHGYTEVAVSFIVAALGVASSSEEFIDTLCPKGFPQLEAEWIWKWQNY